MRFNQILIVDSVPANELKTARNLFNDIQDRAAVYAPAPEILYQRVESAQEFFDLLNQTAVIIERTGDIPVVHIECHGGNDGLRFADGSTSTWAELKPHLVRLNIATQMNLLVVVAACDGSAITWTLSLVDRAPLWGLIGPVREIRPNELERSYLEFYSTLFRTRSTNEAVAALRNSAPDTFVIRTAEYMFQYVWDHYQENHENDQARVERAQRMAANPPPDFRGEMPTIEEFAEMLRDRNPEFFDRFRRLFFLCDLFPGNEQRFNVRYTPLP